MRHASFRLLAVAVLAVGSIGLVAGEVFAAVPTVKGIGKVFQVVNFTAEPTGVGFNTDVVTVPANQTMVVTDLIFSNNSGTDGTGQLRCTLTGQTPVVIMAPILVKTGTVFAHSFGQGIQCTQNTKLQVSINGGVTAAGWTLTVTGYLRKGL